MGEEETSAKNCGNANFELDLCFFFNDATVEERDEVSYKGNNFCYKACPVANSFFFLLWPTLTDTAAGWERETLGAFFFYFCMASSWYFLSFFLRGCSPSASNELNGMKLKVTTRIFVLHLQENVRNYKHKSAKGRTTEKEAPTCEKMIKYEREKWQGETWRPRENGVGWGAVEDNKQICLTVQANGKPFLSFSFLFFILSLTLSYTASLCFCEAQVSRFVCFPTALFYSELRIFCNLVEKIIKQQNIFMAYYCEIMVGGGLKQRIGMGFDKSQTIATVV